MKLQQNEGCLDDSVSFIDLFQFKTQQCRLAYQHNPKKCFYYHEAKKDRRRLLGAYTSEICPSVISAQTNYDCQLGDTCTRAHNRVEEFYHPEKYKVKFCQSYPSKIESCDYGDMCAFAHSEDEVTVDLLHKFAPQIQEGDKNQAQTNKNNSTKDSSSDFYMFHFKTVWCPYSDASHARDACVYAHNWQDFRRKPHVFEYEREQCSQWETKNFVQTYADGCRNEYRCKFSHGWKEQEYHPQNYKMHACRQGESCSKPHCPYFHTDKDKRTPVNSFFKLFPRNRGCTSGGTHHAFHQLYQPVFLNLLFQQTTAPSQQVQSIYGCGPQSVPILDPKIVMLYFQSLMHQQNQYGNPIYQAGPNYQQHQARQQQQSQQVQQQSMQLMRANSQNVMMHHINSQSSMKRVNSTLSAQSLEFKRYQPMQQQQQDEQQMPNYGILQQQQQQSYLPYMIGAHPEQSPSFNDQEQNRLRYEMQQQFAQFQLQQPSHNSNQGQTQNPQFMRPQSLPNILLGQHQQQQFQNRVGSGVFNNAIPGGPQQMQNQWQSQLQQGRPQQQWELVNNVTSAGYLASNSSQHQLIQQPIHQMPSQMYQQPNSAPQQQMINIEAPRNNSFSMSGGGFNTTNQSTPQRFGHIQQQYLQHKISEDNSHSNLLTRPFEGLQEEDENDQDEHNHGNLQQPISRDLDDSGVEERDDDEDGEDSDGFSQIKTLIERKQKKQQQQLSSNNNYQT